MFLFLSFWIWRSFCFTVCTNNSLIGRPASQPMSARHLCFPTWWKEWKRCDENAFCYYCDVIATSKDKWETLMSWDIFICTVVYRYLAPRRSKSWKSNVKESVWTFIWDCHSSSILNFSNLTMKSLIIVLLITIASELSSALKAGECEGKHLFPTWRV